ncbi:MAG: Ig-like domain-containing protein [Pseudoflavonifractor sp.]|nr:Ig-like domain-containing protein [Alloprevotella sp.]MCM1116201.1 Ig-like domain-containing protein [Pseudoflavonifractor sp.]
MKPGETFTPEVTLSYGEDANFEAPDVKIKWESSDPTVAEVDPETGIVTAIANGEATITVTVEGFEGVTTFFSVTVKRPGSVITGIDSINADLATGRREVYDLKGRRISHIPSPGFYIIDGQKTLVK